MEASFEMFDALPDFIQALRQMCAATLATIKTRDTKRGLAKSIDLVRVQRIENTKLWQEYRQRSWSIRRNRSAEGPIPAIDAKTLPSCQGLARLDEDVQELYLFHGTRSTAAWSIAENNFDLK